MVSVTWNFVIKNTKTWEELDQFSDTFGQINDSDHHDRVTPDAFEMVVGYSFNNQAAELVTEYRGADDCR